MSKREVKKWIQKNKPRPNAFFSYHFIDFQDSQIPFREALVRTFLTNEITGNSRYNVAFPLTMNFLTLNDELISPFTQSENELRYLTST